MGSGLESMALLLGAAKPFIDSFCAPSDAAGHFNNWLGPFTPCFTDVIVIGLAHIVGICSAVWMLRSSLFDRHHTKYLLLGSARCECITLSVLSGVAFLVILIQLNARLASHALPLIHGSTAPFEWAHYLLSLSGWVLYCIAFAVGIKRFDPKSPTWLWKFPPWLILTGNLAKLRFVLASDERRDYFAILFYIYIAVVSSVALLSLFHSPPEDSLEVALEGLERAEAVEYLPLDSEENVCPEVKAGLLSRLSFQWMSPLMRHGYRAPLTFADVWKLPPDDRASSLDQHFSQLWAQERFNHPDQPSLVRTLGRATAPLFLCAIPLKLLSDAAQFTAPMSINLLLDAVSSGAPDRQGYLLALCMLGGLLVGTMADNQHFQLTMRAGFRMRSMLTHAIYHKILFLTPDARAKFSSGRLYSAIGSDVDTLQMLCQGILNLISSPVRILVALVLLYFQLGVAAFAAVALLIMLMPLQGWLVQKQRAILRASLSATDERAKLESELMQGIDVVKCYAWEESFMERIRRVRQTELSMIWRAFLVASTNTVITLAIPAAASVGAFGTYVLVSRKNLTPAQAFTSLSLLAVLRFPLAMLPQLIASIVQASVAVGRLRDILASPESGELELLPPARADEIAVSVNGDFAWASDAPPCLQDLRIEIRSGSLVAVVGATGSGKTSLLQACLGLMERVGAKEPHLRGHVALVPQTAFIIAGTVRDNILFGLRMDQQRYTMAIHAACLATDLASFPAGDETEIGERGVTVSGGQKQRIALARAVYAAADVVLMDDPLSALDARVGRRVFHECVLGVLRGKTRILVTNQLQYVSSADRILWLADGRVIGDGTYTELMSRNSAFAAFMATAQAEIEDHQENEESGATDDQDSRMDDTDQPKDHQEEEEQQGDTGSRTPSHQLQQLASSPPPETTTAAPGNNTGRLVEEEGRSTGSISWKVIGGYFDALGGITLVFILLVSFVAVEAARVAAQLWLQFWTGEVDRTKGKTPETTGYYLAMYAGLSAVQVVFTTMSQFSSRAMSVRASRMMHETMVWRLVRAPMSFFNVTPLGRIVNRLTKDTSELDKNLADFVAFFLRSFLQLGSTIALVGALNPFTLWALTPIVFSFFVLYRYFQATVREIKRLDAVSRSPIYTSVGEALGGLSSIRAFRAERRLLGETGVALDRNVVMSLANMSANRWLSVRLETLGALAATAAAIAAVEQRGAAALLGNILSSALQVTTLTNMTLRSASLAEVSFNSAERILEYSQPPQEAAAIVPHSAPHGWPQHGELSFSNVTLRYRPGLPLVLKGLSFVVPGGTSCGVVGRTGAGKSSLINALFRLVEVTGGRIEVDKVEIASLGLTQLRRAMSLIPQNPVLFTGTIRFNLSPFGQHSDAEMWSALRQAHLADALLSLGPLGLDLELAEGGAPLSAGQRQLLALARALLRPTKLLVLDEATASVDLHTDALIQSTVRQQFNNCTILAIAHRLQTVIDADNVLVMDEGRAKEFGPAATLLRDQSGIFNAMVRETGAASERTLREMAGERGKKEREVLEGKEVPSSLHAGVEERLPADGIRTIFPQGARLGPHPIVTSSTSDALAVSPRQASIGPRILSSPRASSCPATMLSTLSRELTSAAEAAAVQLHRAMEGLDAAAASAGQTLEADAAGLQRALERATALIQEISLLAQHADLDLRRLKSGAAALQGPPGQHRWLAGDDLDAAGGVP